MTQEHNGAEAPAPAPAYIVVVRENGPDLSVEYPSAEIAERYVESLFVDGLCEEDAVDCYVADAPLDGSETIAPPADRDRLAELVSVDAAARDNQGSMTPEQLAELEWQRSLLVSELTADDLPADMLVLADSRASEIGLARTLEVLLGASRTSRVVVVGPGPVLLAAGEAAASASVPLVSASVDERGNVVAEHGEDLGSLARGSIAALPARLVIVPASVGSDEHLIDIMTDRVDFDFSPITLPGAVLEAASEATRTLVLVDTPERGLVREASGGYRRRAVRVGASLGTDVGNA